MSSLSLACVSAQIYCFVAFNREESSANVCVEKISERVQFDEVAGPFVVDDIMFGFAFDPAELFFSCETSMIFSPIIDSSR